MNVQNNQNQNQNQDFDLDLDALFDEAAETTSDKTQEINDMWLRVTFEYWNEPQLMNEAYDILNLM